MLVRVCLLISLQVASYAVLGATPVEAQSARVSSIINAELAPDRSLSWDQTVEATLLSPAAVQAYSTSRLTVTEGETLDILEAYTRKPDGRIIPVERSEIATQEGAVGAAMTFLDVKVRQVPFREVVAGDVLVLRTKSVRREHYIPGQVSNFFAPPADGVERNISLTLRAPADVALRHEEKDFAFEEKREGDTIVRRWSGKHNPAPIREALATDLPLSAPHYSFSTFDSYETIGRAYGEASASKMRPTPKVQALADTITAGTSDPAAQADAILRWVARNIRYVAIYFGAGRVVPNDVDVVLARGYGDCKDKAGLATALLAAKGIAAEQVLIQTGPAFRLPEAPLQQAFNHIIVYVPSLDRYADVTDPRSSLGNLPNVLAGKPVIRVRADPDAVWVTAARTPVRSADENVARITASLQIESDGFKQSASAVEASGEFAHVLRAQIAGAETRGLAVAAAELIRAAALSGEAHLDAPNSLDLTDPYRVQLIWKADRSFPLPSNGWRPGNPLAPLYASPAHLVASIEPRKRHAFSMCRPGRISQEYVISLPEGASLKTLPEPVEVQGPSFSFRRWWALEGQILKDRTEIAATFNTRACAPEVVDSIAEAFDKAKEKVNPPLQITFSEPARP
jgi:transglutaminase-like putative cysteine protease